MVTTPEVQVPDRTAPCIEDGKLFVEGLVIDDRDVVEYLATVEDLTAAIVEALRVGVRVLRMAATSGDVEMVKRQFEGMAATINSTVERVLSDARGKLSERLTQFSSQELEAALGKHGRELNSQIDRLFGPESAVSVQNQVQKLLQQQVEAFTQGLKKIVERSDDPENPFNRLRQDVVGEVGKAVAAVTNVHTEVMKIVGEAKGVAAEREKGTEKGRTYQQYVFAEVERIARVFGDAAELVADQAGEKRTKTGDIQLEISRQETAGARLRIVFEAKDRKGLSAPAILDELEEAKENRAASAAVAVFASPDYVPGGLRSWRDYAGHKYICVLREDEPDPFALEFTYRCARVDALRSIQPEEAQLDVPAIREVLKRLRGKLSDFQQMQANLTSAKGSIERVGDLIEAHKKAVREDLDEVDRLFRAGQEEQSIE